jgi:uncharacterized protein
VSCLDDALLREVFGHYRLGLHGYHGLDHWARVQENGLRLARSTGAREDVVELFALFHDSCRRDEGADPGHGPRAARLAERLRRSHLAWLDDAGMDLLFLACRDHTRGGVEGDVTVRTCWDADRLDLARVGIRPDPRLLCTDAARELLPWAEPRGRGRHRPGILRERWLPLLREGRESLS